MNNGTQLRGHGLFIFFYSALRAAHTKGVWAGVMSLWMGTVRFAAENTLTALVYSWKARQFMHWRLSRKISEEAYRKREAACAECPQLIVADDGRYPHQASHYCGSCGCSQNRWSELRESKNWRRGHICPLLKFPEQAEQLKRAENAKAAAEKAQEARASKKQGGCGGCGGKKGAGPNGRGHPLLEDWHRNSGLLAASTRGTP